MLRRILTLISISFVAVFAAEKSDENDGVQKSLDKILSKAGIQFNGEFKSQYRPSKISGSAVNDTTDRQLESTEFTSVDFDVCARPNSMVSARTIFRFHQNWQNFFSDVANPIFARWISIDGNVKDMLSFNVGDFKEKYSALTLYSPDIEILNEPYIFARQKDIAMDELFLGNNNRVLQGLNLSFDAEIDPVFNEFHLGLIGSRMRSIVTNIQNGSRVVPPSQESRISKYFIGGNLDVTFLKGINFGVTELFLFDQKSSYRPRNVYDTLTADTLAQRTNIISFRPGIDIGKMISSEVLKLALNTEIAISNDDTTSYEIVGTNVTNTGTDPIRGLVSRTINGSAIDINVNAGFSPGESWGIDVDVSFIANSNDFRNELAQSPSFFGDRMTNKENNMRDSVYLYNTFDALYHSTFKFTPSTSNSNRWSKSPFMANSYTRAIFTQDELAVFANRKYFDPAVQLIMPYGPATPNRTGVKGKISAKLINEAIKIDILGSSLKEIDEVAITESISIPKTSFTQIGGGLKVDISKMVTTIKYPLEVSGSYVKTKASRPAQGEMRSNFLNAGLYYKFWKRTALMAGYQMISNTFTEGSIEDFGNWSVGLEWKVADGADVVATVGQMTKENPGVIGDVSQTMGDVSLRVKF